MPPVGTNWTSIEDDALRVAVNRHKKEWKKISIQVFGHNRLAQVCAYRWRFTLNKKVKKGCWNQEEDKKLKEAVTKLGENDWLSVSACIPGRLPKQCYERWSRYLHPDIDNSPWTTIEDVLLLKANFELGNKWSKISKLFVHRPAHACHNRVKLLIRNHYEQIGERSVRDKGNLLLAIASFLEQSMQSTKQQEDNFVASFFV